MDAYSRRIIGWSMAPHIRTELVLDALGMAVLRRVPESGETILHSDHGSQYLCPERERAGICRNFCFVAMLYGR
jgi:transposase InsO family protein